MNSQITPVSLSDLVQILQTKTAGGTIEMLPDMLTGLKINDKLTLDFLNAVNLKGAAPSEVLVTVTPSESVPSQTTYNQRMTLNVKLDLPVDISRDGPLTLEIKITSLPAEKRSLSFNVTAIDGRRPEVFVRDMLNAQPAENIKVSAPAVDISLSSAAQQPLKAPIENLRELIVGIAGETNFPAPVAEQIAATVKTELPKSSVLRLLTEPEAVKDFFSAMFSSYDTSATLPNIKDIVQNILTLITGKNTPIADKNPVPMPEVVFPNREAEGSDTGINWKIGGEKNTSQLLSRLLAPLSEEEILLPTARMFTTDKTTELPQKDGLFEIIRLLRQDEQSRTLIRPILNKVPNLSGEDFITTLINYVKAADRKDLSQWLGRELSGRLEQGSVENKETAARLNNYLNVTVKEQGGWRLMEIPVIAGEQLSGIRLAVKKEAEEREKKNPSSRRSENGTRFVVDTDFSVLGKIQFDGMSFEKRRNFDLIVRTEKLLPADVNNMIKNIFNQTLHKVDYSGRIEIKFKEIFIKPWNNSRQENTSHGIFV